MTNIDISCEDMAKGLQHLMTFANFSGLIIQPECGPLLQYHVEDISDSGSENKMKVSMGENSFIITVSPEEVNEGEKS
jgi:hypothetical protein